MKNDITNLVSISKNKYNINLLETLEFKELFHDINPNISKLKTNLYQKNKNNDDKNDIIQSKIIDNNNYKIIESKTPISKSKKNSKSFKDMIKNKLNNLKYIIKNNSPENNIKFKTQNNSGKDNIFKKIKKNISSSVNKKLSKNKNINLSNFNFQRNQPNNDYFNNNDTNSNSFINFNKSKKKEDNKSNLDVYNRLYNKSYYKKKNKIIIREENKYTFNPQLLSQFQDKEKNVEDIENFIKRQEKFNDYIQQKKLGLKIDINKKEGKKYTFTPNTSCTSGSKYSIKLEAQRQEESKLDKTNRMVYEQIKKMEVKNNNLFLMYNNQYSFIPSINKKINFKKFKNFPSQLNPKRKAKNITTYKKEKNNDIIIPHKYKNHQYDDVKSHYKNDKELMMRIKEENQNKKKKIDIMRREQDNIKFQKYTFKPVINRNNLNYMNNVHLNSEDLFHNKSLDKNISYTSNYNKKKNLQNKDNRSFSCCHKNIIYRNNNNIYQDTSKIYYNSNFEKDIHDYNNDNNTYLNYNHFNTEYNNENDNYFNQNYPNNYYEYNDRGEECNNFDRSFNNVNKRNYSMEKCKNNDDYMYMTPKGNKIYKSRAIKSIKKEDKENFLLIHKLLYDK